MFNMETKTVNDIEEVIYYSKSYQTLNPHHPIQIEVINPSDYTDFITFCHNLAEIEHIDELSGWSRKRSERLKFEDVIHKVPSAIKAGMKINHFTQYRIDEWEKWPDGYIQTYIRMDSDVKGNEWFIWQYIQMSNLENILNEFQGRLEYFYLSPIVVRGK